MCVDLEQIVKNTQERENTFNEKLGTITEKVATIEKQHDNELLTIDTLNGRMTNCETDLLQLIDEVRKLDNSNNLEVSKDFITYCSCLLESDNNNIVVLEQKNNSQLNKIAEGNRCEEHLQKVEEDKEIAQSV